MRHERVKRDDSPLRRAELADSTKAQTPESVLQEDEEQADQSGGLGHDLQRATALPVQAKLEVGAPDDPAEEEADRVAEQVMRMELPEAAENVEDEEEDAPIASQDTPQISRKPATDTPFAQDATPIVEPVLRSGGQPLDAATRAFMEPRFGHDFSDVRVHADSAAAESARAVNARAYTVGRDVVFGDGEYAAGSSGEKGLLAHELTHVVQQVEGLSKKLDRQPKRIIAISESSAGVITPSDKFVEEGKQKIEEGKQKIDSHINGWFLLRNLNVQGELSRAGTAFALWQKKYEEENSPSDSSKVSSQLLVAVFNVGLSVYLTELRVSLAIAEIIKQAFTFAAGDIIEPKDEEKLSDEIQRCWNAKSQQLSNVVDISEILQKNHKKIWTLVGQCILSEKLTDAQKILEDAGYLWKLDSNRTQKMLSEMIAEYLKLSNSAEISNANFFLSTHAWKWGLQTPKQRQTEAQSIAEQQMSVKPKNKTD